MNPYRILSSAELRAQQEKLANLSYEERAHRQHLASVPTLRHKRWERHFHYAWSTLIASDPSGAPTALAERAKALADAAFYITEPLYRDAVLLAERVYNDGVEP